MPNPERGQIDSILWMNGVLDRAAERLRREIDDSILLSLLEQSREVEEYKRINVRASDTIHIRRCTPDTWILRDWDCENSEDPIKRTKAESKLSILAEAEKRIKNASME